jgi:aminodeoxyfutalosine synthase
MTSALSSLAEEIDTAGAANGPRPVSHRQKVEAGQRLTPADALTLFESDDLLAIGALADAVNRQKNGDRVFICANQHLNPTNVCILRATCTFCSFARKPKEDGAYTMTLEEAFHEASLASDTPVREFHIVGGLHPKLRVSYYEDLIRGLKERHPGVEIKALTAVEIAHLARIEKSSIEDVLIRLRDAGMETMPGGGAEVFAKGVRATIASASSRRRSGSTCTARRTAWGSAPTARCCTATSRVDAGPCGSPADAARAAGRDGRLPDLHPARVPPGQQRAGRGAGPDGHGDDRVRRPEEPRHRPAVPGQHPHIKTHWIMNTAKVSQIALHFGVDDLEGTVRRERIYHEAGASTPEGMTFGEIVRS